MNNFRLSGSRKVGVFALSIITAWTSTSVALLAATPTPASKATTSAAAKTAAPAPANTGSKATSATGKAAVPSIIALPEVPQTAESIDKVMQALQEGEQFFDKNETAKALSKFQEAYGDSIEMKFASGEGRALTDMCSLYMQRGQMAKAKELGENALEVLADGADKQALGKARVALAQAYMGLDNPVWAGQQLDLALQDFSKFGNTDPKEAAKLMELVGNILGKMNENKDAVNYFHGAATYYGQSGDKEREVSIRIFLANKMNELGWTMSALEETTKALNEVEGLGADERAAVLGARGSCQYNLGEYPEARKSFEEALALAGKGTTALSKANMQSGYAHTLAAIGDLDQARDVLSQAMVVLRSKGTLLNQAQAMNTLASIETLQKHYSKASELYEGALELSGMISPKQDRLRAVILQNLAACQFRSNDYRNCKAHLESAEPLMKKLDDPILEGRNYSALAEVCMNLKDSASAEQYLRKGISISEKIGDDAALWRDYTLLARLLKYQDVPPNLPKEALTSALSYFRSPQAGYFPSPDRLGFMSPREDLGQHLVSELVSAGIIEPALLAAEQLKEESFINEWHRRGGQVKPEDKDIYNDLVTQRAHLHAAEATATPTKLLGEWKNWLTRFQQLGKESRSLARLIAPVPTSASEIIKDAQDNHCVVIDYLLGANTTVVFTIDSRGTLAATSLPVGRNQLQGQVSSLLAVKDDDSAGTGEHRTLQNLYSELFPPEIRQILPSNPDQTVVIIPDGILFNLPFAALIDGQNKYLIESHTLTMASSMGVFLDSPPRYSSDQALIVSGSLSGSSGEQETDTISSLFQPDLVTRLVGKEADLSNFQEQAKGKAVLHFTSTVPFQESNPLRAVLPLLPGKEDKKNSKVTADRLFGMTLPNDLAVWSATSINAKDLQGNAVKVFSRGLSYAGVRNVLMSLWVEPDPQRTSELVEFYRSNQSGLNQAQSLRKAQLLALSKNPSPRSWAAFQLLGPGF